MTRLDNLIQYEKTQTNGKCSKCGSENIQVDEMYIGRRSITFICKTCGSGAHFDGTNEK